MTFGAHGNLLYTAKNCSCNMRYSALAVAIRTDRRFCAWLCTGAVAIFAHFKMVNFNFFFNTKNGFFKFQFYIKPEVMASLRSIRVNLS